MPTMAGHFSVFHQPAVIHDPFDGDYMEWVAPGAFRNTFAQHRDRIRCIYAHGRDAVLGSKPLGPITELREDAYGAYYEVALLDADYTRSILPAIEAGLLGASFAFQVVRERFVARPPRSASNPAGLPEVEILEARVREFGPCTFGAYPAASSALAPRAEFLDGGVRVEFPDSVRRQIEQALFADRAESETGWYLVGTVTADAIRITRAFNATRERSADHVVLDRRRDWHLGGDKEIVVGDVHTHVGTRLGVRSLEPSDADERAWAREFVALRRRSVAPAWLGIVIGHERFKRPTWAGYLTDVDGTKPIQL